MFRVGGSDNFELVAFDLVSSVSLVCCARMLLNIRDVLSLSDPRDTTKPDPWSLDPSFDVRYGLGGMDETTPGHDGSGDYYEKPIVSQGPDSSGGAVSGATNYDGARRMRGEKLKALDDEESGPSRIWGGGDRDRDDAGEYHHRRDMMLGLGGSKDGTASDNSPVSPAGTSLGSLRSPWGVERADGAVPRLPTSTSDGPRYNA